MIFPRDIKEVRITDPFEVETIKATALKLQKGGYSSVYSDHAERMSKLEHNQLTGQCGEGAVCKALYGFDKYVEKSEEVYEPGEGDGGQDIPGASIPIDVKSSCVSVGIDEVSKLLYHRHLMVSKREYSPNMIYIAAVLTDAPKHTSKEFTVYVLGWCWGSDLPWDVWTPRDSNEERSAFRMKYVNLRPLKRMSWKYLLERELSVV